MSGSGHDFPYRTRPSGAIVTEEDLEYFKPNDAPPPKMPGAMPWDCENELNARLNSWTALVIPRGGFSCLDLQPGITDHSGLCLCCSYHRVAGYDAKRPTPCAGVNPNAIPKYWVAYAPPDFIDAPRDPLPLVIDDPVKLGFDPIVSARADDGHEHEGVAFGQVWSDPLARMTWMVLKSRILTDQYFRKNVMEFADWARNRLPLYPHDVWLSNLIGWGNNNWPLRLALYRHIVRVLLDEGRWPYLMPPRTLVAE
jgi:hypothetical protein